MRELDTNESIKNWQRLVCASSGAIVTSIIVTPLDVIKIRMQLQNKPLACGDCFIYCNGLMDHIYQCLNGKNNNNLLWNKPNSHFLNSFDALQKIVKSEGILSLWSGLSPTLIMAVPQVVIYYTLNDWLKSRLGYNDYVLSCETQHLNTQFRLANYDFIPPFSGALSRFVAQATIAPLELLRTKMQSKKHTIEELHHILKSSIKEGGFSVLWRGMAPTMWRDVPYTITLWFIYEYLKKDYMERHGHQSLYSVPYYSTFLFSSIGAFFAGVISHPFDVTKTHRQAELGHAMIDNKPISSTWSYLVRLKRHHGFSGLFIGFGPRMLRVILATSIMITIFETSKSMFVKHNSRSHCKHD